LARLLHGGHDRAHRRGRQVALVPSFSRGWLAPQPSIEDGDLDIAPALQGIDLAGVDLQLQVPFGPGERLGRGPSLGVPLASAAAAWQRRRMVLSSSSQPATSARARSARANDLSTPRKQAIRLAPRVT